MRSRRDLLVTIPVGSLAGLSGCLDGDPPVDALDISLVDLRAPEAGLTSITIPVLIEVTNGADGDVPTPTISFDAVINGEQVATGQETVPTVHGGDDVRETVDITIEYETAGTGIVRSVEAESFELRLRGTVRSDGATVEFDETHRL